MRWRIVISGVNLVEGGTLKVFLDAIDAFLRRDDVEVIVVAHDRSLLGDRPVRTIAMPEVKKRWWKRVYTELVTFRTLSRELRPDLWLSMHDMTPNIEAPCQMVYCHNPSPFYAPSRRQIANEPVFGLFNLFYGSLYRINIARNDVVIVQQNWLKRAFERRYPVRRVISASPVAAAAPMPARAALPSPARVFLYPALPRTFKNMEVLVEAARLLEQDPAWSGRILLTIAGDESRYARWIAQSAQGLRSIELIGRQSRQEMTRRYAEADVVLFPSTLETWGLPIIEGAEAGKPLLVADRPYAYETARRVAPVRFLDPDDPAIWAEAMRDAAQGVFAPTLRAPDGVAPPDVIGWDALIAWIVAYLAATLGKPRAQHQMGR